MPPVSQSPIPSAIYSPSDSDGPYCFCPSFFSVSTITHEPLHLAWWYFGRTCTLTTARTLVNGHRSKVKVIFVSGPKFTKLILSNVEKIVVANAVYRLSTAWSVPQMFAIEVQCCPKSSSLLIIHEPLHLAWWNIVRTSLTTWFQGHWLKVKVTWVFRVFLCAWYCGGYPRTVLSLE